MRPTPREALWSAAHKRRFPGRRLPLTAASDRTRAPLAVLLSGTGLLKVPNVNSSTSIALPDAARTLLFGLGIGAICLSGALHAGTTTVFFNSSQTTNLVASGTTSDTVSSQGYVFTLSMDKLFTGGVGLTNPIGRPVSVHWPAGLQAQAVTTGPNVSGAQIVIQRQDHQPFAIESFTAKLLANTAGAGGSFEIMPQLNGVDPWPDPAAFDATGYAGNQFTYTPATLTGFDTYTVHLYVDFALTALTLVDPRTPPTLGFTRTNATTLELIWPSSAAGSVLEVSAEIPSKSWQTATNAVSITGDQYMVQLEAADPARFYRLRN